MSDACVPDDNSVGKEKPATCTGDAESVPGRSRLYLTSRSLAHKWMHNTYFAPFYLPLTWRRRIDFYLSWFLRLAYLAYLYFSWTYPFQTGEWLHNIELRGGIIADGIFQGPIWDTLGLSTSQPGEGWEFLPPKHSIWQDEIAWISNEGRQENIKEVFDGWSESWKHCDEKECAKRYRFAKEKHQVMRAMTNLQFDGVWKEGMSFEEWVTRMDILRYVHNLLLHWEVFRHHKKWYILLDHDSAPIFPSLTFFLSRLDSNKAYYLSFGRMIILSSTAVEILMETNAFNGLALHSNSLNAVNQSLLSPVYERLGLGTGNMVVSSLGTAPSYFHAILEAAARRRNIHITTSLQHLYPSTSPDYLHISPANHCQVLLGFNTWTKASGFIALKKNKEALPSWPLRVQDVWTGLNGFPSWEGMYGEEGTDGWSYYGRGGWDNVGPTSRNMTRQVFDYWAEEYAEYDDGSWSVVLEAVSNECQERCYEGGLSEPSGTRPRCLAYKSEPLMRDGEVAKTDLEYREKGNGLTKCTFVPWKVAGEESEVALTMVNDLAFEPDGGWRQCEELDARQFAGVRIFPSGQGTGCDTFKCRLQNVWEVWMKHSNGCDTLVCRLQVMLKAWIR